MSRPARQTRASRKGGSKQKQKEAKRPESKITKDKYKRNPVSKAKPSTSPMQKGESSKLAQDSQSVHLYCAIHIPEFGNFYHWAFAMNHRPTERWQVFQVIQEELEGPFIRNLDIVDPASLSSCLQPLKFLGQMSVESWDWLPQAVKTIPVPGEGESWNCQDYVMEIWALLLEDEMIDEILWNSGYQEMLPYYGQDFGDQGEHDDGADQDAYEEDDEMEQSSGIVLSEAFVYDSDS